MDTSEFFGADFTEDDYILTEEEAMAIEHEQSLVDEFRNDLAALRARDDVSQEDMDRKSKQLLVEYLQKADI